MSRLWVFPSTKPLLGQLRDEIEMQVSQFLKDWTAHKQALHASLNIAYDHFLVVSVNEDITAASGCSIDTLMRFMQELDLRYQLNLFDRQKVAVLDNGEVKYYRLPQLKNLYKEGIIQPETPVFNNMISSEEEYKDKWLRPLAQSPYKQFAGA